MKRPRKGSIVEIVQTATKFRRAGVHVPANDSDSLIRDLGVVRAAALLDADQQISFRVPTAIVVLVDAQAKALDVSRSAWIVEAIAEKLAR